MRKFSTVAILSVFVLLALTATAFAADTIGYFREEQVFAASKRIPEIRKEFKQKAERKIAAAKQQASRTDSPKARKQMLQQLELDLRLDEEAAIEPAIKEINLIARKVAISKGVTALVDSQYVCYGGVDITEDVVKALKAESK